MAQDAIAYDKSDLRGVLKAFKAMDEEATAQAKIVSGGLATYVQGKIVSAAVCARMMQPTGLQLDHVYQSHQRSVSFHLALHLRNSLAAAQRNSSGAVMNLDQINISNSRSGLVVKVADRRAGLSIQRCEPSNRISLQNGRMPLAKS